MAFLCTDFGRHDITEILLKVTLSAINLNQTWFQTELVAGKILSYLSLGSGLW